MRTRSSPAAQSREEVEIDAPEGVSISEGFPPLLPGKRAANFASGKSFMGHEDKVFEVIQVNYF